MPVFRLVTFGPATPGPGPFVAAATYLPLSRWRYLPTFQRWNGRVRDSAARAPGLLWYSVQAKFGQKTFWTLSVWASRDAMRAFVRSEPHATAMRRFSLWGSRDAAFGDWESPTVWVTWKDVYARLGRPPSPGGPVAPPLRVPESWDAGARPPRWPSE
jgi:hypothetical protein